MTASIVILFVLFARLLLKKAPKGFSYVLWYVVLFRLLCPVAFSSPVSLLGMLHAPIRESGGAASSIEYIPNDIVHTEFPEVDIPIPGVSDAVGRRLPRGAEQLAADPLEFPTTVATYLWGIGFLAMAGYSVITCFKIRRKLRVAILLRDNIFVGDDISYPFVIGFIRPRIYLPCGLSAREREYIILHERHHIRRLDHIVKALAFMALCIHWFNPLVWLAFVLLGKDMEMSCDEAVIRKAGEDIRADYSASLLALATGHRRIAGTPLAFGEGDAKGRIRNLANWKKPGVWVVLAAVAGCIGLTVCLLTNPMGDGGETDSASGGGNDASGAAAQLTLDDVEALSPKGDARVWYDNNAVVVAVSDLDHDGETENVVARTVTPGEVYELSVEKEDGTQVWTREAGIPHTGWGTIMLYSEDGQDYLMEYFPAMFQGIGSYTCTVFSLEDGKETVKEQWSVDFELPVEESWEMTPEMTRFSEEVGVLLRNSIVLLSTEQGILVRGPQAASDLPQIYPVRFDPDEIWEAIDGAANQYS